MATLTAETSATPLKQRLAIEIALALYEQGQLPVGKAMEVAGKTRREFMQLIRERGTNLPYSGDELERDLALSAKG